jgi:hypothetical protein
MENIEAMLCAYIEGDLDEAGRAQIEKHLQEHPQHRKLIAALAATRDLVRDLPRAKAPPDVGEWVHGQVERSILLDDSGSMIATPGKRPSRWPQLLGVAAVLLLFVALAAIVMRMVAPTFKAPLSPTVAVTPLTPSQASKDVMQELAKTNVPSPLDRTTLGSKVLPAQLQPSMPAPFDLETVRRRLQDSGYASNNNTSEQVAPVVLVINSSNQTNTAVQVAQFLNNAKGISWRQVPEESNRSMMQNSLANQIPDGLEANGPAIAQLPATRPQALEASAARQNNQYQFQSEAIAGGGAAAAANNSNNVAPPPTTQPATDMYVAQGMTAQQAEELRQSLAGQPDVQACQVYKQIALDLPATRPAANTDLAVVEQAETAKIPEAAPTPVATYAARATTQPTTAPTLADTITASTPPPGFGGGGGGFGATQSNRQMALSTIDAVIVVQPAVPAATGSPAVPATEPATTAPDPSMQP